MWLFGAIFQIIDDQFRLQIPTDPPVKFEKIFQRGEESPIECIGSIGDLEFRISPVGIKPGKMPSEAMDRRNVAVCACSASPVWNHPEPSHRKSSDVC